jgi:hypothetical protein
MPPRTIPAIWPDGREEDAIAGAGVAVAVVVGIVAVPVWDVVRGISVRELDVEAEEVESEEFVAERLGEANKFVEDVEDAPEILPRVELVLGPWVTKTVVVTTTVVTALGATVMAENTVLVTISTTTLRANTVLVEVTLLTRPASSRFPGLNLLEKSEGALLFANAGPLSRAKMGLGVPGTVGVCTSAGVPGDKVDGAFLSVLLARLNKTAAVDVNVCVCWAGSTNVRTSVSVTTTTVVSGAPVKDVTVRVMVSVETTVAFCNATGACPKLDGSLALVACLFLSLLQRLAWPLIAGPSGGGPNLGGEGRSGGLAPTPPCNGGCSRWLDTYNGECSQKTGIGSPRRRVPRRCSILILFLVASWKAGTPLRRKGM